ncbi:unnamed protein product [Prunus armeniaca]|uniref:Uncharacterized protein n=1 Tax=Prunus armeniaca TaxID=36596 RepID=A0A6J5U023_PRUAR|nr:unnamed protein product [Prunus armeniaca]
MNNNEDLRTLRYTIEEALIFFKSRCIFDHPLYFVDQYYYLFSEPPEPDFVSEIQPYFPIQMPVVSRCNCDRDFPDRPLPRWFPIFFQSLACAPHEQDVVALLLSSAK